MRRFILAIATLAGAALATTSAVAGSTSINFDVTVTADNQYGLYTGTLTSADAYIGGAFNTTAGQIYVPETYSLTLNDDGFIYITSWSDLAVLQGLMGRFDNLTLGGTVYTGVDPRWEVTATGINRANGAAPVSLPDLSTQIVAANAGANPSNGWVPAFSGPLNNNSSPWGNTVGGGMGPQARWTWYNSGDDPGFNAPFSGFDHDEYLIFRLPVNVPEPATLSLLSLALLALRRR